MAGYVYIRKEEIGSGSYGRCFLALKQSSSNTIQCVIKEVDLGRLSPSERALVSNEAQIMRQLNHPNIIRFYDVYKTRSGKMHIVMEYAERDNLHSFVKSRRGKLLSEDEALLITAQLFLALKYLHERNIMHRDLKPENVFLMGDGTVKLGDFGISKTMTSPAAFTSTFVGSPVFQSPEQWAEEEYSFPADVWAAGVLLYELCAQRLPFEAANHFDLAEKVKNQPFLPLPEVYSQELKELLDFMLRKDPATRPTIFQLVSHPLISVRLENHLSDSIRKTQRYPVRDFPMVPALPRINPLPPAMFSSEIPSDPIARKCLLQEVRRLREDLSKIELPEEDISLQMQELRDNLRNYLIILDVREAMLATESDEVRVSLPLPQPLPEAKPDIDIPEFPESPSRAEELRQQLRSSLGSNIFDEVYRIIADLKSTNNFKDYGTASYKPHLQHLFPTLSSMVVYVPQFKLLLRLTQANK